MILERNHSTSCANEANWPVMEHKREQEMKLIHAAGAVQIWEVTAAYGKDFYVYRDGRLVRVCPSIGMAHEVAA